MRILAIGSTCRVTLCFAAFMLFAFSSFSKTTSAAPHQPNQATSAGQTANSKYSVGVGKANITPTEPMWMAGYAARTSPFQEILMDIWCKAIVIQDSANNKLVLITLDLVGIDRDLADELFRLLKSKHGLERSQVSIAVSHSHSGPIVGMNLRVMHFDQLNESEQKNVIDYKDALIKHIDEAVSQALKSLQPASLNWSEGTTTFAANRRNNSEADVLKRRAEGNLFGPVDHSVPVLVAYNSLQQPIAIVFGYACHSTVLSQYKICGDYPGFAQAELEKRFPTATALFWAGCGADINPIPRRSEPLAEFYGRQLAGAVESVLLTQWLQPIEGLLSHRSNFVPLKLAKLPTQDELVQQSQSKNIYEATRAKLMLKQIDNGKPLSLTYDYPVQTWKLGNGPEWIHLGGEVVVDYSLRIKRERNGKASWVTSYANDVMAYIPSERVLREGGYEGATSMLYYGFPSVWAEGVEQALIDEVNLQLTK